MKWDWSVIHMTLGLICGFSLWWSELFAWFFCISSLIFEAVMFARPDALSSKFKGLGWFFGSFLAGVLLPFIPWVKEAILWTPK